MKLPLGILGKLLDLRTGGWSGKAAPVPDEDSPGPRASEGPPFASVWSTFGL